jgi:predicted acylesterase/phospholipase RssA
MVEEGVTIWQAGRATSTATSFFDPITIGEGNQGREYVDGALGFNNPLDEVWLEAQDIWTPEEGRLESMLKCVVSVGTGNPGTSAVGDKPWTILETLKTIATQTENTERVFAQGHRDLLDKDQRYYRFNVEQGLQKVGLEEYERQGEIIDATAKYLNDHQLVRKQFWDCAVNLSHKECMLVEDFS